MTEKEMRKLNRYQLLEMLIIQTERADKLQARLELALKKLNEQELHMSELGSIAEASLKLKGVFQAAQEAADMYLEAAKRQADGIEEAARRRAEEIITKAQYGSEGE